MGLLIRHITESQFRRPGPSPLPWPVPAQAGVNHPEDLLALWVLTNNCGVDRKAALKWVRAGKVEGTEILKTKFVQVWPGSGSAHFDLPDDREVVLTFDDPHGRPMTYHSKHDAEEDRVTSFMMVA